MTMLTTIGLVVLVTNWILRANSLAGFYLQSNNCSPSRGTKSGGGSVWAVHLHWQTQPQTTLMGMLMVLIRPFS